MDPVQRCPKCQTLVLMAHGRCPACRSPFEPKVDRDGQQQEQTASFSSEWEKRNFEVFALIYAQIYSAPTMLRPLLETIVGTAANAAGGLVAVAEQGDRLSSLDLKAALSRDDCARKVASIMLPAAAMALARCCPGAGTDELTGLAVNLAPSFDVASKTAVYLSVVEAGNPLGVFLAVAPMVGSQLGFEAEFLEPENKFWVARAWVHGFEHCVQLAGLRTAAGPAAVLPTATSRVSQLEAVARHARPPRGLVLVLEPSLFCAAGLTASLSSGLLQWLAGAATVSLALLWLGHLNYYFGSKWKRIWHRLDHAWVPFAAGISAKVISWDDALKAFLAVQYPNVNRDGLWAEFVRDWDATDRHVVWLRGLVDDPRIDWTTIVAIRERNGITHLDVIEAIIRRECDAVGYRDFVREQFRRGMPWRGIGRGAAQVLE